LVSQGLLEVLAPLVQLDQSEVLDSLAKRAKQVSRVQLVVQEYKDRREALGKLEIRDHVVLTDFKDLLEVLDQLDELEQQASQDLRVLLVLVVQLVQLVRQVRLVLQECKDLDQIWLAYRTRLLYSAIRSAQLVGKYRMLVANYPTFQSPWSFGV